MCCVDSDVLGSGAPTPGTAGGVTAFCGRSRQSILGPPDISAMNGSRGTRRRRPSLRQGISPDSIPRVTVRASTFKMAATSARVSAAASELRASASVMLRGLVVEVGMGASQVGACNGEALLEHHRG